MVQYIIRITGKLMVVNGAGWNECWQMLEKYAEGIGYHAEMKKGVTEEVGTCDVRAGSRGFKLLGGGGVRKCGTPPKIKIAGGRGENGDATDRKKYAVK